MKNADVIPATYAFPLCRRANFTNKAGEDLD